MPELPEVETVRRSLNNLTLQQKIQGGEILLPRSLAYPPEIEQFWQGITDKAIAQWHRRGKYLLAQLAPLESDPQARLKPNRRAGWLGVHLRMTGQLLWLPQDSLLQKHTRLRLFFPHNQELRFVDTRTFGKVWYCPPETEVESVITGLQKLGPEPFEDNFSVKYFSQKLNSSRRQIKTLLLDQAIVAGIGNIYADEALFKSGILPYTVAAELKPQQIKKLYQAIIEVLQTSIDKGGTTFSDFLDLLGVSGNYGDAALVYGRKDQPCKVCHTPIEKIKLGGRSAHFCPHCQK